MKNSAFRTMIVPQLYRWTLQQKKQKWKQKKLQKKLQKK